MTEDDTTEHARYVADMQAATDALNLLITGLDLGVTPDRVRVTLRLQYLVAIGLLIVTDNHPKLAVKLLNDVLVADVTEAMEVFTVRLARRHE